LLLIGQLAFGLLLDTLAPRGTPLRAPVINLHKSIGLALLVLIALRLGWRLVHRPPRWPSSLGASQRALAHWGHRLLYAVMLALPVSGYVGSNLNGHGIRFFGLITLPAWGPHLAAAAGALKLLHASLAWALIALVAGHVALAARHALRRDGLFERMW
jgi:cytochrome b561